MYQVIIVVHVFLGLGVIGLILMQQGKGADAGAAFGSGSSGSVFGAQGAASFLSRTTAILATLFFTTSLTLAILSGKQSHKTVDLMDATEVQKSAADVPLSDKPATTATPALGVNEADFSADEKPAVVPSMAKPIADEKSISGDAKPVDAVGKPAVDDTAKVDEHKQVEPAVKAKASDAHKKPEHKDKSDKSEHKDKTDKSKHKSDKKEADKKHKSHTSDKKVEKAADKQ